MRGIGFWRGLLRVALYAAGPILLVRSFGWWGVAALPLLIPLVWLAEMAAFAVSDLARPNTDR